MGTQRTTWAVVQPAITPQQRESKTGGTWAVWIPAEDEQPTHRSPTHSSLTHSLTHHSLTPVLNRPHVSVTSVTSMLTTPDFVVVTCQSLSPSPSPTESLTPALALTLAMERNRHRGPAHLLVLPPPGWFGQQPGP